MTASLVARAVATGAVVRLWRRSDAQHPMSALAAGRGRARVTYDGPRLFCNLVETLPLQSCIMAFVLRGLE